MGPTGRAAGLRLLVVDRLCRGGELVHHDVLVDEERRQPTVVTVTALRGCQCSGRAANAECGSGAAVRSVRTRAACAAKKVPTDTATLSIAAGVLAGIVAAGIAIFFNRDKLRDVAATGGERLKKAADDLSTLAHDRIDQARDNITRFRSRSNGSGVDTSSEQASSDASAMHS